MGKKTSSFLIWWFLQGGGYFEWMSVGAFPKGQSTVSSARHTLLCVCVHVEKSTLTPEYL